MFLKAIYLAVSKSSRVGLLSSMYSAERVELWIVLLPLSALSLEISDRVCDVQFFAHCYIFVSSIFEIGLDDIQSATPSSRPT